MVNMKLFMEQNVELHLEIKLKSSYAFYNHILIQNFEVNDFKISLIGRTSKKSINRWLLVGCEMTVY